MIRFLFCLIVVAFCFDANAQHSKPEMVTFQSGDTALSAYLWVPKGTGPFRAIVWNYGHSQPLLKQGSPSRFDGLAQFYVSKGYVLFIPDRTSAVRVDKGKKGEKTDFDLEDTEDIIAAVSWLRQQSFVNASKVAVTGMMSGAVLSAFAAERDTTIRAAILFSPASQTWSRKPDLQRSLERAIDGTPVPMFLIQPQNDADLGPSEVLGRKLARKGGANRSRVYPPFGSDPKGFSTGGIKVWGKDVVEFLDLAMK